MRRRCIEPRHPPLSGRRTKLYLYCGGGGARPAAAAPRKCVRRKQTAGTPARADNGTRCRRDNRRRAISALAAGPRRRYGTRVRHNARNASRAREILLLYFLAGGYAEHRSHVGRTQECRCRTTRVSYLSRVKRHNDEPFCLSISQLARRYRRLTLAVIFSFKTTKRVVSCCVLNRLLLIICESFTIFGSYTLAEMFSHI